MLPKFLGAVLFGLVGLVALHAKFQDACGNLAMFLFAILVIGMVVVALFRWIVQLMKFRRIGDTLDRVKLAD